MHLSSDRMLLKPLLLLGTFAIIAFTGMKSEGDKVINFTVYSTADHVKIHWTTVTRKENTHYAVERSRDGKVFETLMVVTDPGGEPPGTTEFIEVDFTPLPGWSYYRIRRADAQGRESYTHMVPVFFGADRLQLGELIAPDPLELTHTLSVNLSEFDNLAVLLVLRNEQGIEFYDKVTVNVQDGILKAEAGGNIPAGIYTITASSRDALVGLLITIE